MRKWGYDPVKVGAQAIFRAQSHQQAEAAFRVFRTHWVDCYRVMVKRLERDLPELLTFFHFLRHLWCKLRATNAIERCFVEVWHRTRPMICFVKGAGVERTVWAIFNGYNERQEWRNRTPRLFTHAA